MRKIILSEADWIGFYIVGLPLSLDAGSCSAQSEALPNWANLQQPPQTSVKIMVSVDKSFQQYNSVQIFQCSVQTHHCLFLLKPMQHK